jgi:hypothetical protein
MGDSVETAAQPGRRRAGQLDEIRLASVNAIIAILCIRPRGSTAVHGTNA